MKTYLHHRNIYCQKYNTIVLPPNAVCMGDLVYLPVYKINKNNDPGNETNLNMPIQVPIQIPSKLPYNTPIFQANRFSNSLDPKLLDRRKIETIKLE